MLQDELEKLASYVRLAWNRKLTESNGGNMSIRYDNRIYNPNEFR